MMTPPPTPDSPENAPATAPMTTRRAVLAWISVTHPLDDAVARMARDMGTRPGSAAVLFDIDGVLAPIVANARDARVPDEALDLLAKLTGRYLLVGAISGRGLADVDRMVPVPGIARGGNHGLEVAGPGEAHHLVPEAEAGVAAVRAFVSGLTDAVLAPRGVWMEDKGPSVSLHFREAPDRDAAEAYLRDEVAPAARAAGLRTRGGKMILELLPDADVDKGTALRTLVRGSGARAVLYVGDDRTDADAWRSMRAMRDAGEIDAAHCVVADGPEVDPSVRDAADAGVDGPAGVRNLMRALASPPDG
jgi:trehalose 6-phosphate phosphatase